MHRQLHLRALAFIQASLLLATLLIPALAAAATIQTDLWVYQDGDTVTVTGVDFGASENVDFATTDPDGVVVDTGSGTSDELGNVTYAFTLHVTVGGLYTVTGTGSISGSVASVQFDPLSVSTVTSVSTVEGSASHTQNVTVKVGGGGSPITVFWRTVASGNATAGASCGAGVDYVTTSGSTSTSGDFTVPVTICGDSAAELDETFDVQASATSTFPSSPPNATRSGTVTIANDDTAVSIADVSQNEGNTGTTAFSFLVSLNASVPAGGAVNLTWLTSDGTADNGNCVAHKDYNSASGSLSFLPGDSTKTIVITVCGDTTIEPDETFTVDLTLASTTNFTVVVSDGHAVGTILNDDSAPTNTPPSVSVTGVTNGAAYTKGSVPSAGCSVVDTEDGNSSFAATLSAITGPNAADGLGSQTASCAYTDGGGLTANASATYTIVDSSAPSITYVVTPASPDGNGGWYRSSVTLTWTVTDADSPGSLVKTGCVDQDLTADQPSTTYSCSATSAGGSTGPVSVSIKIDLTAPTITDDGPTPAVPDGLNGWYISAVSNAFSASDGGSGLDSACSTAFPKNVSTGTAEGSAVTVASGACSDVAGNTAASINSAPFKVDLTAPTITDLGPTTLPNAALWYNHGVANTFQASDATSGLSVTCLGTFATVLHTEDRTTAGEGLAVHVASDICSDVAGNTAPAIDSANFKIDLTNPYNVTFVGGSLTNGGSYYFGFVPAGPTSCTAADDLSGFKSCGLAGYSTAVGTHTVTATALDNADNSGTATLSYSVSAWTLKGFYQPVDMNDVVNTVKGGSTVPLKFNIFAGPTELTAVTNVKGFKATQVTCGAFVDMAADAIEITSTGGTTLRYDGTTGQFIQNWQTPKSPNTCWVVAMTTQDGSSLFANFQLR